MADTIIGRLIYKIVGDQSQLLSETKKSDKEVKGLAKSFKALGTLIKGAAVAGAITLVTKKLFSLGKELISSASDAEEVGNKYSVVFSAIEEAADDATENLVENFGLSSTAAKTLLSDTGDLLTGFGFTQESALDLSSQVNTLAVDLASFTNFSGGAEGASKALTKALLGERESVKALGISILEADVQAKVLELTQQGLVFETERQAKAYATLQIAIDQSANAIGDFERSSESYANQTRIAESAVQDLKDALGVSLLPIATQSVSIFGELTSKLADFIAERNKLAEARENIDAGTDTAQDRLNVVNEELRLNRKSLAERKAQLEALGVAQDRITASRIDDLNQEIEVLKAKDFRIQEIISTISKEAKAESEAAQEIADGIAAEQQALEDLQAAKDLALQKEGEARDILALRRFDSLSDEEQQIQLIQEQIDKWVEFREVEGVQSLINDLVRERNDLLDEQAEKVQEQKDLDAKAAAETLELFEELKEANAERRSEELEALGEKYEEEDALRQADLAREKAAIQEKIDLAFQFANASIGFLTALDEFASATGDAELQRLEEAGASEEELEAKKKQLALDAAKRKKALGLLNVGIDTASAIIGFLADPGGIPGIALSVLAGVTGGIQAAAIAATPLPAFANGGIVPGSPSKTDNTVASVASGELIANQAQKDRMLMSFLNGGGSGGQTRVIVNIGKKAIIDTVAQASKDGTIIIDSRSVKG